MTEEHITDTIRTSVAEAVVQAQSNRQRIGFDRNTWIALVGLMLGILTVGGGLTKAVFQTRVAAIEQQVEITKQLTAVMEKHTEKPHRGAASAKHLHSLDKELGIQKMMLEEIGKRVGAEPDIRRRLPSE